jgi:hypothetical protein
MGEIAADRDIILIREPYGQSDLERERDAANQFRRKSESLREELARLTGEGEAMAAAAALRETELAGARDRLAEFEQRSVEIAGKLAEAEKAVADARAEAAKNPVILAEHKRLYQEFEDLRQTYNEIVTKVMPELQKDREELITTVERQCAETDGLRLTLAASRKNQAVGYSLGVAAILFLVALPVFNWLRSGDQDRDLARSEQRISELNEQLRETKAAMDKEKRDLDQSRQMATKLELDKKNLSRLAEERGRELAKLKGDGVPTRASIMALQGKESGGNGLKYNEVRDPAGRIKETVAQNRRLGRSGGDVSKPGQRDIQISAVARTESGSLRPTIRTTTGNGERGVSSASPPSSVSPPAPDGIITAKVRQGEGVAQVVSRVLGRADPEIINWVIRENRIKRNSRGNPLIYKDQVLRLPGNGTTPPAISSTRSR